MRMVKNILSIDVEEIFHIEYAKHVEGRYLYRSDVNVPFVVNLLREFDTNATFFMTGEILEKFPEIREIIIEGGHEIAFHGWSHTPLWHLDTKSFEEEIHKFRHIHSRCLGYRAPSFSLNNHTKWALEVISKAGFRYDSSIIPTWTPLYGVPKTPLEPYYPSKSDISKTGLPDFGVLEFPLLVNSLFGVRIPTAGGFWLRFWNIYMMNKSIQKMNKKNLPAVIYIHNWELDSETPKLKLGPVKKFITYHNFHYVENKLKALLGKFKFSSFSEYLNDLNLARQ